jgi:2-(1,2-epoxy-1,2-dihydrophenyl)acetyl-CoA isomerase
MSPSSSYEVLGLEVADGVGTVTLNRPDALNALNFALKAELASCWQEIKERDDVRVVLLTGAGRAFCAGGDISQWEPGAAPVASRKRWLNLLGDVVVPLARMEKPVIAAVNGHAHGAGFSLALAADVIYAAESALFSLPFAKLGLVPDTGALYFLPRIVGLSRAKELVFSGRRLSAGEAHDLGLVNHVVPDDDLGKVAREFALSLAAGAPLALGMTKRLLDQSLNVSLDDMVELESYAQAVAIATEDHAEGVRAFREKRVPRYTGA